MRGRKERNLTFTFKHLLSHKLIYFFIIHILRLLGTVSNRYCASALGYRKQCTMTVWGVCVSLSACLLIRID